MARMPVDALRVYGRGILLAATAVEEGDAPKWMQVAKEGKFKGHPDFPELDFSRAVFASIVTNFRAHPSYLAGADGYGSQPVVPYDYEHASEMDPTSGSIPANGAPAPAWVLDLEVRDAEDGSAQLWALTKLGPKLREQIKAEEYRWTSVAVWRNGVHPVSGDPIGPVLTSIAVTNHPFIQGMMPLAASARGARELNRADVWGEAESPEEAIIGLRSIFGLEANAPPDAVLAQLARFGEFVANGAFPMGVDGEWMMRRLRELFGLPALATWEDMMGAAGAFLTSLVSDPGALANASTPTEDETMPAPLAATLAATLKCRDNDDSILAAAKEAAANGDALDKLKQLFGSSDVQSLLTDAGALVAKAGEFGGVITALTDAMKAISGGQPSAEEQEQVEQEAAAAMASLKLSPELCAKLAPVIKLAVVAVREHALANQEAEAVLAGMDKTQAERLRPIVVDARRNAIGKPELLSRFRKSFPLANPQTQLLTRPVFAGPGGSQMGGTITGLETHTTTAAPPARPAEPGALPGHITAMGGRNATEKTIAYLSSKNPAFAKKSLHEQVFEAGNYLRSGAPAL